MGGYAALALWERHPHRVRSLVLMDTRSGADSDAARAGRRETAERVTDAGGAALVPDLLKALLSPDAGLAARVRLRGMIEATPAETIVSALEGMARRADRTGILSSITVPTLVMVGEDDERTPPDVAEHMAALIPGAELVVLPGAGHLPPLETPEGSCVRHDQRFSADLDLLASDQSPDLLGLRDGLSCRPGWMGGWWQH